MNSLASIAVLRQFLALLGQVQGDKTVILISGGWPMDDRDEMSTMSMVAAEAAAVGARASSRFTCRPRRSQPTGA